MKKSNQIQNYAPTSEDDVQETKRPTHETVMGKSKEDESTPLKRGRDIVNLFRTFSIGLGSCCGGCCGGCRPVVGPSSTTAHPEYMGIDSIQTKDSIQKKALM